MADLDRDEFEIGLPSELRQLALVLSSVGELSTQSPIATKMIQDAEARVAKLAPQAEEYFKAVRERRLKAGRVRLPKFKGHKARKKRR